MNVFRQIVAALMLIVSLIIMGAIAFGKISPTWLLGSAVCLLGAWATIRMEAHNG